MNYKFKPFNLKRFILTRFTAALSLFSLISTAACTNEEPKSKASSSTQEKKTQIPWPTKDLAGDQLDDEVMRFQTLEIMTGSGTWKNSFWINFNGANLTGNDSFIVEKAKISELNILAFEAKDLGIEENREELIKTLMNELERIFDGIDIDFTTSKPATAHSIIHVGGKDSRSGSQALGVAPLDVGNFSASDIGFAFSQNLDSTRGSENLAILVHTIAHEISHSLGAMHIKNETAIMNPIVDVKTDRFTSGPLLNSEETQDTYELLAMTAGVVKKSGQEKSLPEIIELDIISQENIGQYSVYSLENLMKNPKHNLNDFIYTWKFGSTTVEGPTVRIRYDNKSPYTCVLTVKSKETAEEKNYTFEIGMIN